MASKRPRPNILHIFTDMQRWDTIGALGNRVIRTPNLDRLVSSGVSFTNAYTPSPVCISARAAMIHGQYPHNTGCYENTRMPVDGRQSFMDALTAAGYRTHGVGKCHFTPDRYALRGFQSRELQEEGGIAPEELDRNPYHKHLADRGYDHVIEAFGVRSEMYYVPQVSQVPAADHATQWVGDRSLDFVRGTDTAAPANPNSAVNGPAAPGQPWYLFASFLHPHPPFNPPTPWHKLYRGPQMPMPFVPRDHQALLTLFNHIQNRFKYRDQGIDLQILRTMIAYYYSCISFVDFQVGRLLDALEETGQADNTLVVFASDHGELLGDYNSFGKRSMHDGSSRVPLIARLPGRFEGGHRIDAPANLVDLAPTFLAVAEAEITDHELDGEDLFGLVSGTSAREIVFSQLAIDKSPYCSDLAVDSDTSGTRYTDEERRARFSIYMAAGRDCKYVYSAPDAREYFFDRNSDPRESRNRAGVAHEAPRVARAKRALLQTLHDGGESAGLVRTEGGDLDWRSFPTMSLDPDPDSGLIVQDMYTPWARVHIPGYTD